MICNNIYEKIFISQFLFYSLILRFLFLFFLSFGRKQGLLTTKMLHIFYLVWKNKCICLPARLGFNLWTSDPQPAEAFLFFVFFFFFSISILKFYSNTSNSSGQDFILKHESILNTNVKVREN